MTNTLHTLSISAGRETRGLVMHAWGKNRAKVGFVVPGEGREVYYPTLISTAHKVRRVREGS